MRSYLNTKVALFATDKKPDLYVDIVNLETINSISNKKWVEIIAGIKTLEKDKIQLAKAYMDKPEKILQWFKSADEVRFEFWYLGTEGWIFQNEHIVNLEDLKAFAPIFEYSLNILKVLEKEIADKALSDTAFLSRE
jgi:hypothetical protein